MTNLRVCGHDKNFVPVEVKYPLNKVIAVKFSTYKDLSKAGFNLSKYKKSEVFLVIVQQADDTGEVTYATYPASRWQIEFE